MKKIITKFWGVALTVILLSSLFVFAAPAGAVDPLMWNTESIPGAVGSRLTNGFTIEDFAINGDTAYAVGSTATSANVVYKSTNGGSTWTLNNNAVTLLAGIAATDMVAVAPDDANIVVVVDATTATPQAWVTTTGGAVWGNLALGGTTGAATIYDVTISPSNLGTRYIAVAGDATPGVAGGGFIYYYPLGALVGGWTNAVNGVGWTALAPVPDAFHAVEFSPNFASDFIMIAVSFTAAGTTNVQLHAASFNSFTWNAAIGSDFTAPGTVMPTTTLTKASLVLSPDYSGADSTLRVAFVGIAGAVTATTTYDGIVRMNNNIGRQLLSVATPINSVAYNGALLVAGAYASNIVYYSTDPLAVTPTVLPARANKRPGLDDAGNDQVVVGFHGEEVVASKRGAAGAFAKSIDNGVSFNDISLMNTALTNITDLLVAADGSQWYFASNDGTNTSVFAYDGSWARVLNLGATTANMLLRSPADNPDAIYVGVQGGTALYFSDNGGQNRWFNRTAPSAIADIAAETADVVYLGTGSTIRKSINQGFTWLAPVYPFTTGNIFSLNSMGANVLLIGSDGGRVSYSTDGASTFTRIAAPIANAGNVMATADGLAAGNIIYAVTDAAGNVNTVYKYVIGTDTSFQSMGGPAGALATTGLSNGIKLAKGALYVSSNDAAGPNILRNTLPAITTSTNAAIFWGSIANTVPITISQALWGIETSTASVKLWAANSATAPDTIYSWEDTLVDTAPAVTAPASEVTVPLNPTNNAAAPVVFSWNRASLATAYTLTIALDPLLSQGAQAFTPINNSGQSVTVVSNAIPVAGVPTPAVLVPGTTYYWAVQAAAPVGGARSEVRSFTVQPMTAAVPVINAPANGAVVSTTTPAFSWSPVTAATMYEFQLSELPGFEITLFTDQTTSPGEALPVTIELEPGKTYFWRVRALEPVQGDWSTVANFTVAAETTTATTTQPPVTITETTVTISVPGVTQTTVTFTQAPEETIAPAYIWAIIIIGAILVIAVIVLIVRTRRSV